MLIYVISQISNSFNIIAVSRAHLQSMYHDPALKDTSIRLMILLQVVRLTPSNLISFPVKYKQKKLCKSRTFTNLALKQNKSCQAVSSGSLIIKTDSLLASTPFRTSCSSRALMAWSYHHTARTSDHQTTSVIKH